MKSFEDLFRGKRVLVTGHTGFKGSWLSMWLLFLGAEVVGYSDHVSTEKDNFAVSGLSGRMVDIRGDVRDSSRLEEVILYYRPTFIFHLAAQALVIPSYEDPRETFETNIMGTVNLLESVRKTSSIEVVLIITSDKCYRNMEWDWGYRENDILGGEDPYSSSKACVEKIVESYIASFFDPQKGCIRPSVATVRAGNVIGGGDWSKYRLIPDCMGSLLEGRSISIRHPHAVRPWQHVLDPLGGYLLLASKMYKSGGVLNGAWNFGPTEDSPMTVKECVELIIQKWGSGSWVDASSPDQFHETSFLSLDTSKVRSILGWRSSLDIENAFEYTIDWVKTLYRGGDMYQFGLGQVNEFMERANGLYGYQK